MLSSFSSFLIELGNFNGRTIGEIRYLKFSSDLKFVEIKWHDWWFELEDLRYLCIPIFVRWKKNLLIPIWYFFVPVLGDLLSWAPAQKNLSVCREMIGKDECWPALCFLMAKMASQDWEDGEGALTELSTWENIGRLIFRKIGRFWISETCSHSDFSDNGNFWHNIKTVSATPSLLLQCQS